MRYVLIVVIGYILGNVSSSYLVGKLGSNIDVRQHGSGNLGTTNAYRVLGIKAGALVFIGDVIKGILATIIGLLIVKDSSVGGLIGGIAAVAGHNWPFLLGFKGGKGIATSFGTIIILFPLTAIILLAVVVLIIVLTGYVSLGSITAAVLLPILAIAFRYNPWLIVGAFLLAALAILRHKANISRLLKGTENKITSTGGPRGLK
ncbi:MAG TPA: glycerol-3-phosphate 1-O-acyltransferase PlsY [Clostridia bacterium]|nr:glycerol-3-phosphate 1-O-acyltransferase PlsY [Clostridia bacterium]